MLPKNLKEMLNDIIDDANSDIISSGFTTSMIEEQKFNDISGLSSVSGGSFGSHLTSTVSIGLCGLAGKPNLSMNESEQWIIDPRTPIKKFANLLFKLASVRQQINKQLVKDCLDTPKANEES